MPRGCPQPHIVNCPLSIPQDLENPMDMPAGWLRGGDIGDLAELSGDEDELLRVTEGAGAPGGVGGRGGWRGG